MLHVYQCSALPSTGQPGHLCPDWPTQAADQHRLQGAVQQGKRLCAKVHLRHFLSLFRNTSDQKGNGERSNTNHKESCDDHYFERHLAEQPVKKKVSTTDFSWPKSIDYNVPRYNKIHTFQLLGHPNLSYCEQKPCVP